MANGLMLCLGLLAVVAIVLSSISLAVASRDDDDDHHRRRKSTAAFEHQLKGLISKTDALRNDAVAYDDSALMSRVTTIDLAVKTLSDGTIHERAKAVKSLRSEIATLKTSASNEDATLQSSITSLAQRVTEIDQSLNDLANDVVSSKKTDDSSDDDSSDDDSTHTACPPTSSPTMAPIIQVVDPNTGCEVSSQAVLDVRNQYAQLIFDAAPQFWPEFGVSPPSGNLEELIRFQRFSPAAIAEQDATLDAGLAALRNIDIEGLYEYERHAISLLAKNGAWSVAYSGSIRLHMIEDFPRSFGAPVSLFSPISFPFQRLNGFNPAAPAALPLLPAIILQAGGDLQLMIDHWANVVAALDDVRALHSTEVLNDNVISLIDMEAFRDRSLPNMVECGSNAPIQVATCAPVTVTKLYQVFNEAGTPAQQASAIVAIEGLRASARALQDIYATGGVYAMAAAAIRGDQHPGLGSPLIGDQVLAQTIYARYLRFLGGTELTPAEILALGATQVSSLQTQFIDTLNANFDCSGVTGACGIPYADWATFRSDYNSTFNGLVCNQPDGGICQVLKPVLSIAEAEQRILSNQERLQSAAQGLFGYQPRSPINTVFRYGSSSGGQYSASSALSDGTGTVILSYGTVSYSLASSTGDASGEWIGTDPGVSISTTAHESWPGHALQVGNQVELQCKIFGSVVSFAAAEGWGLYAEKVAAEDFGFYTPSDTLSYLNSRMFRAVRLLADPGLHTSGLSTEAAEQLFFDSFLTNAGTAAAEIRRYTSWPAQATSYLINSLLIEQQRQKTEDALAAEVDADKMFVLREWHDLILRFYDPDDQTTPLRSAYYVATKQAGTFADVYNGPVPQKLQPQLPAMTSPPLSLLSKKSKQTLGQYIASMPRRADTF